MFPPLAGRRVGGHRVSLCPIRLNYSSSCPSYLQRTRRQRGQMGYVNLAHPGPYVKLVDLPKVSLFQAGKFPALVEFMRGVASEIRPQVVQLLTGANLNLPLVYELGLHALRRLLKTISSETVNELRLNAAQIMEPEESLREFIDNRAREEGSNELNMLLYGAYR